MMISVYLIFQSREYSPVGIINLDQALILTIFFRVGKTHAVDNLYLGSTNYK